MTARLPTHRPSLIRIKRFAETRHYVTGTEEVVWYEVRTYGFNKYTGKRKLRHSAVGTTLRAAIEWQRRWRWRGFDGEEMPSEKVLQKLRARRSP